MQGSFLLFDLNARYFFGSFFLNIEKKNDDFHTKFEAMDKKFTNKYM